MPTFHTLASFAKPQPDTIAAIFLLKKYGEPHFPGISSAKLELWTKLPSEKNAEQLEDEGYLLVDLGHGRFDHHNFLENGRPVKCSSEIVAEFLGLQADPSLQKLLAYAKRDDLQGKGTISNDPLDRAFGLSGLLSNLNRAFAHDLPGVISMVLAMFEAHQIEEENRTKIMPAEWKALSDLGEAKEWSLQSDQGWLRVIYVPSDNYGMAGFLKAYHRYDIVVIRRSTNHVNIITSQSKHINLSRIVRALREMEAKKKDIDISSTPDLTQQGRILEIPEWYYDTMANTLQNGGINTEGIDPTILTTDEIHYAVRTGLEAPSSSHTDA